MTELWPGGPLTLPHEFTHDGVRVVIPELPLNDLLYWLSSGQWWQLYPNSVDPDMLSPLRDRLFDPADPLDMIHLHTVATTLFGRLSGMAPSDGTGWWPAVRLANLAIGQWPLFHSWCVPRGVTPLHGNLMTTVTAAYAWIREGLNPEQLGKLEQDLWATPTSAVGAAVAPEELPEHVRQEEAGAFLAALGEALPGQQNLTGVF